MNLSTITQGIDALNKFGTSLNEARQIRDNRRILKTQMKMDIKALEEQMQQYAGEETVSMATSGFKYGGSKANLLRSGIQNFKLREAQLRNQSRIQRKAMQIAEEKKYYGAFGNLSLDFLNILAGEKPKESQPSPMAQTPQLGSSYSQSAGPSFSIFGGSDPYSKWKLNTSYRPSTESRFNSYKLNF